MSPADPAPWLNALAALEGQDVTAVLTVQCGLDWLRPTHLELRDQIDEALVTLAMTRSGVRIDRIMLHNLPAAGHEQPGELLALNSAHDDWRLRLELTGMLLRPSARPHVHLLIVSGAQRNVGIVDGIELRRSGTWTQPDTADIALGLLRRPGATTPLHYELAMDGPFGDADPSVYL